MTDTKSVLAKLVDTQQKRLLEIKQASEKLEQDQAELEKRKPPIKPS